MGKELFAGGASIATAIGAMSLFANQGFPFPNNDSIEKLFIYVLAPLSGLGGYWFGRILSSKKNAGRQATLVVVSCIAIGVFAGFLYIANIKGSPGMIMFVVFVVIPFMSCIGSVYTLASFLGFGFAKE